MQNAINKAKTIQEAALVYQNNLSLFYRKAGKFYKVSVESIINYCSGETIPAPDVFITS